MKKRILSTLLALCVVLAMLPGTAWAVDKSGSCGPGVTWTFNSAGALTINGSGKMTTRSGWYYSNHEITTVNIGNGIIAMCDGAFEGCSNLIRVTLPNTMNEIASCAFIGCISLPRVTIPSSVTSIGGSAFRDCKKLASIEISSGVTSIGSLAFLGCTSISSLDIPSSVTSIGKGAFQGCTMLGRMEIPSGVNTLVDDLFSGCSNLTSVTLPRSIDMIGANVFTGCDRLKDIYYAGTQQQWEDMYIDPANDVKLASITIHYNSGGSDEPETYTVTLDPTGGNLSTTEKEYKANAALGTLPTPTRTGYKFNGWYTEETGGTKVTTSTKVTADMTLYAHWTKNPTAKTYTITLNANSGKVSPSSLKVESGKTYYSSLPTPTRTGYKFDGWYTSKTGGAKITSTTKATANRTIYAHWSRARMLLVTFDGSGGMVDQDQKTVRTGRLYGDLPTPTKNNAHFQGWYTKKSGGTKVTETTRVSQTAGHTLYARWGSSATVRNTQRGTYRVTIPTYYDLAIYASSGTAKISSQVETTAYQTITCTQRATLSNGTVRYYGKVNGKTGWFTYSCEMDIE